MNYELLKQKMDKFFQEVKPGQIAAQLQRMGYKVVDIEESKVCLEEVKSISSLHVNELPDIPGMSFNNAGEYSYAMAA